MPSPTKLDPPRQTLTEKEATTAHVYVIRAYLQSHDLSPLGDAPTIRQRALTNIHSIQDQAPSSPDKSMTTKTLKAMCVARGLPYSGAKAVLLSRLATSTNSNDADEDVTMVDKEANDLSRCLRSDKEGNVITQEDRVIVTGEDGSVLTPNPDLEATAGTADGGTKKRKSQDVDEAGWISNGTDDDDERSVATQRTDHPNPKIRMGLQLTTPPTASNADKQLFLAAKEWFKKMKEEDPHFRLLPWKAADSNMPAINIFSEIPETVGNFRCYFNRIQIKSKGGPTYGDVLLQHSVPMTDLTYNVDWFFKEKGMRLFPKTIQAENISQMGWLLYSYGSLDTAVLAPIIAEQIGAKVGLRYKYINSEKYEIDRDQRKKWMAVHVECMTEEAKQASRGLKRLYGMSSTSFPLGIRMRLVSEYRDVKGNPANSGKHTRLRVRQCNFLQMVQGCPNDDIGQLDWKEPKLNNQSLRDLIMGINSDNPATPGTLFHGVGQDWKGRFVFSYLANKAGEAAMIADGIIPYLMHHHGPDVAGFFDAEGVATKASWSWDDVKKCIVNPLSKELDLIEDGDADYSFAVPPPESATETVTTTQNTDQLTPQEIALSRMNLLINAPDADSVSTMGNPLSPNRNRSRLQGLIPNNAGMASSGSVASAATIESRLSMLENNIQDFKSSMKSTFQESIKELLANLPSNQSQPPGGAAAGEQID